MCPAGWCNQSAGGAKLKVEAKSAAAAVGRVVLVWFQLFVGRKLMFFNLQVCVLSLSFWPATHRQILGVLLFFLLSVVAVVVLPQKCH